MYGMHSMPDPTNCLTKPLTEPPGRDTLKKSAKKHAYHCSENQVLSFKLRIGFRVTGSTLNEPSGEGNGKTIKALQNLYKNTSPGLNKNIVVYMVRSEMPYFEQSVNKSFTLYVKL